MWTLNPFLTPGFLGEAPRRLKKWPDRPDRLSEEEAFLEFGDSLIDRFLGRRPPEWRPPPRPPEAPPEILLRRRLDEFENL